MARNGAVSCRELLRRSHKYLSMACGHCGALDCWPSAQRRGQLIMHAVTLVGGRASPMARHNAGDDEAGVVLALVRNSC